MSLSSKTERICRLLEKEYGVRKPVRRDPIDTLVSTILSQNTSDTNSEKAFENLKRKYRNLNQLLTASVKEISDVIKAGGLANIKAKRIKEALEEIKKQQGSLNLDFLSKKSMDEARNFLRRLKGVGPKTAACVLIFSFGMPALPVDTHIFRVSKRLGLIDEKMSREKAHKELENLIDVKDVYSFHLNMIAHGRKVCKPKPLCGSCILNSICDYYRTIK